MEFAEELVKKVLDEVKGKLGDTGLKSGTLSLAIRYTMEAIEDTPVKGPAQLNFALRILGDLINELEDSEEKKFLRQTLDNGGIKDTIELIVQATKGEFNINKLAKAASGSCLKSCGNYLLSKCRK